MRDRGSEPSSPASECRLSRRGHRALDGVEFELELKCYGEAAVDGVLGTQCTERGVLERVEFTGSNPLLLALLKRREPAARVGLFSAPHAAWMSDEVFEHHVVGVAETSGADVVHVRANSITPRIADRLHALGMVVHANDASGVDDLRRAAEAGCRTVCRSTTWRQRVAFIRSL